MLVRLGMAASAVLLGLFTVVVAHQGVGFSVALTTPHGTAALLGTGWALMLAAVVCHRGNRGTRRSWLLFAAGISWFLAEWANPASSSPFVFSVGLALYAACPALIVHAALNSPGGHSGGMPTRLLIIGGYLSSVGLLGVGSAAFFDPESEGCLDCPQNLWLMADNADLQATLTGFGLRAMVIWSAIACAAVALRLIRARGATRRIILPGSLLVAGYLVAVAGIHAVGLDRGFLGIGEREADLWLVQGSVLTLLAVSVAAERLQSHRTRRKLTQLVVDLGQTTPGNLRDLLAAQLRDPDLILAYPIDAGRRYVDAAARPVVPASPNGRTATTLQYRGADLAVLVHRPGLLTDGEAVADLVTAMRLGLEHERLYAQGLSQLADISSSGVRIVEAADEERRRLERDLHDGAQQRLVAVALGLRMIGNRTPSAQLGLADGELRAAIAELRLLARGLYPEILTEEGLRAALLAMSETSPVRVGPLPATRLPAVLETTAYLLVAKAARSGPTDVTGALLNGIFTLDLLASDPKFDVGELADRVAALRGELHIRTDDEGRQHLQLRLPI